VPDTPPAGFVPPVPVVPPLVVVPPVVPPEPTVPPFATVPPPDGAAPAPPEPDPPSCWLLAGSAAHAVTAAETASVEKTTAMMGRRKNLAFMVNLQPGA
jgi:hypothetical protein